MTQQESGTLLAGNLGQIFPLIAQGKVRDIYQIDEKTLLFVATDRISAFDVVMGNGIPSKGIILTLISAYWFKFFRQACPQLRTHFISLELPPQIPASLHAAYKNRSMVVRKVKVFPIESIVRGYISGSAWNEYRQFGTVNGISMPQGLQQCGRLPRTLWTPSTKGELGEHDINIHPRDAGKLIGQQYADAIQTLSTTLYNVAFSHAYSRGIIIADTKFEFGLDEETNEVVLIDEVLTPDSSRFWPVSTYEPGSPQQSFDKQFLRNWLLEHDLASVAETVMPPEIVKKTELKYQEAYERITGEVFTDAMPVVSEHQSLDG